MKALFIEFVGTFFLVLTVALTGNPLAIGAILAAMVYMGGYISGAHYNPVVTLAMVWTDKLKAALAWRYIAVQLMAGIAAAATALAVSGERFLAKPGLDTSFGLALILEVLFTFALVSVVLHTAATAKTDGNSYYGLAIGLVVLAGAAAVGPLSGGAFNPAVGVAPALYDFGHLNLSLIGCTRLGR